MRLLKIAMGLTLALATLFVILGEPLAGTSADAVVSARLTTVRAPIAGEIALQRHEFGSLVTKDEEIGSLGDPLFDDVPLNDLILERATIGAEIERSEREIAAHVEAIEDLEARSGRYSVERSIAKPPTTAA